MNYFQNLYLCDWEQRIKKIIFATKKLWITFKICIFVTPNNRIQSPIMTWRVVNYFQFVSLWFETTSSLKGKPMPTLWITFKICIFVIWNNLGTDRDPRIIVVNYFQNLYLCDFKQRILSEPNRIFCCELLSKFVSLWLQTTSLHTEKILLVLWITFKICIFVTSNNVNACIALRPRVVNYFQNLYLCDFKQP